MVNLEVRMKRYRSAITGEYVTEEFAKDNPDTTVGETVEDIQQGNPFYKPETDTERNERLYGEDSMEGFSEASLKAYHDDDIPF